MGARLKVCSRKSASFRQILEEVDAAEGRKADVITGHLDSFDALVFPDGQNVVTKPEFGDRRIGYALAEDNKFLRGHEFSDLAFDADALWYNAGTRFQLAGGVVSITGMIFDGQPDKDVITARLKTLLEGAEVVPLRRDHVLYDGACSLWTASGPGDKEIMLSVIDARKIGGNPAIPGACLAAGIGVYSGLRNIVSMPPENLFTPYRNTRMVSERIMVALNHLHGFGIKSGMSRSEARAHLVKEMVERQKQYEQRQLPPYQHAFGMCPAR